MDNHGQTPPHWIFETHLENPGKTDKCRRGVKNISPGNDKNTYKDTSHYRWPLISLLLGQESCCTSGVEEVMGHHWSGR